MRLFVLAFLASGCELVFPLRDGTGDDVVTDGSLPPDAPDLTKPIGHAQPTIQAITGEMTSVDVTVLGTVGRSAAYMVEISQGEPTTNTGMVTFDDMDSAHATFAWIPGPVFSRATFTTSADYDPALTDPRVEVTTVDVFQRFGKRAGGGTPVQLVAKRMITIPIDIPKQGIPNKLSVQVRGATSTSAILGIYSGATAPVTLEVSTEPFPLTTALSIIEVEVTSPPLSGRLWLAFVAADVVDLGADDTGNVGGFTFDFPELELPGNLGNTGIGATKPVALAAIIGPP